MLSDVESGKLDISPMSWVFNRERFYRFSFGYPWDDATLCFIMRLPEKDEYIFNLSDIFSSFPTSGWILIFTSSFVTAITLGLVRISMRMLLFLMDFDYIIR